MTEIIMNLLICLFIEFLNNCKSEWFLLSVVLCGLCVSVVNFYHGGTEKYRVQGRVPKR
jgi:hypothetical protein